MFNFFFAFFFFVSIAGMPATSALADVPVLPTMSSAAAQPKPGDHTFIGRVAQFLDDLRPARGGDPLTAASRNPAVRDPARDRDATSFGLVHKAPINSTGASLAAAGLGGGAAQLVDLGNVAKKVPVKIAPTVTQGGGGVSLKLRW
jgi:hypothetical protein